MRAKDFVIIAGSVTKSLGRGQSLSTGVCFPRLPPFEKQEDERACKRDDVVRRLDSLRTPDALAHVA
jgi:hypothetical protein